mgnify:CR=1 FL=1
MLKLGSVIDGKYKINYKPAKKLPIEDFLKPQKRFKHMFLPGNEWMIEELQAEIDRKWNFLLMMEETTQKKAQEEVEKSEENTNEKSFTNRQDEYNYHEYGNVGVTTSQQMLQAELDVRRFNIYEQIADLFVEHFCLLVY